MCASPSQDDRGDAASAAAAPDIKAPASFTDSGGGNSEAAGEDQAGGDLKSLIHDDKLKDQQLRAAEAGRSAQAKDADPLFPASIQWNARYRLDASAGHKLQPQHQKQQQQKQQQQRQQHQQSQHQQDREQQQQLPQPQQQQQHPQQQHVLLEMGESGEGTEEDGQEGESAHSQSSNSNSDDGEIVVTSVSFGDPGRLQEQHGRKKRKKGNGEMQNTKLRSP
jgi:hypothetical protein